MKDLSEKFDQLPQDFDREAIWQGIKRPKARKRVFPFLWGALFMVAAAGVIYMILPLGGAGEDKIAPDKASLYITPDGENISTAIVRSVVDQQTESSLSQQETQLGQVQTGKDRNWITVWD